MNFDCYTVIIKFIKLVFITNRSISSDPFVDLHVLQKVGFLTERLGAGVALEGLLASVRTQVNLDVGLVEEAPIADVTPMDRLFLAGSIGCHDSRHLGFTRTILVFGSTTRSSTNRSTVATAATSTTTHWIIEIA